MFNITYNYREREITFDPTSQNQFVSFPQNVPQFQSKRI